jgi:DNA-binding CsgD family transcriptional regulator
MPDAGEMCRRALEGLKFDDEAGRTLDLPGVARAAQIERASALGYFVEREAVTRMALLEAMSSKADAVILLGATGAASFMNEAAVEILVADDGLAYIRGELVARRPPESRRLHYLIANVLNRHGLRDEPSRGQMLVSRQAAPRPYVVRVMPAPRIDPFSVLRSIACIVLVQDLARDTVSGETLSQLFGLSRREGELAAALVRRGNLRRAAADAAMATNTARNHLQAIFLKTSVNSQVALVGLLSRLV